MKRGREVLFVSIDVLYVPCCLTSKYMYVRWATDYDLFFLPCVCLKMWQIEIFLATKGKINTHTINTSIFYYTQSLFLIDISIYFLALVDWTLIKEANSGMMMMKKKIILHTQKISLSIHFFLSYFFHLCIFVRFLHYSSAFCTTIALKNVFAHSFLFHS